jgi:hypothetical protein
MVISKSYRTREQATENSILKNVYFVTNIVGVNGRPPLQIQYYKILLSPQIRESKLLSRFAKNNCKILLPLLDLFVRLCIGRSKL